MADLSLIVLRVKDIEVSTRFYTALGISFTMEQHGSGPSHMAGQAGAVVLELYPADPGSTTTAIRLGFSVPSFEGLLKSIIEAGGTIISAPKRGPRGVRAVLADPDGNRVEVVENIS